MTAFDFGRLGRVRVLNNDALRDLFDKTYGKDKAAYGLANPVLGEAMFARVDALGKKDRSFLVFGVR